MRFTGSAIFAATLFGAATVSGRASKADHHVYKRSECIPQPVAFHLNDSSLAIMDSCTSNLINLAGARNFQESNAPRSKLSARDGACVGNCTNGPSVNYTVISGDSLGKIAAQFDSGVCDIAKANNISRPDSIGVGQLLAVPTKVCQPDNQSCRPPPGMRPCLPKVERENGTYTLSPGDTFFIVGQIFNVTVDSVLAANPCADPGTLPVGAEVKLPLCPDCSSSCPSSK